MLAVVAPVLQTYAVPAGLTVSVELWPLHTLAGEAVIVAVGLGFMVTKPEAVAEQPPANATVTV